MAKLVDITIEDIIVAGVVPDIDPMQLKYIGQNWFKDNDTGTVYRMEKDADGTVMVAETRQSKTSALHKPARVREDRPPREKRCTVTCCDCGATREINVQDKFQVKRCVACQKKHRNTHRLARLRVVRAEKKAEKSLNNVRDVE